MKTWQLEGCRSCRHIYTGGTSATGAVVTNEGSENTHVLYFSSLALAQRQDVSALVVLMVEGEHDCKFYKKISGVYVCTDKKPGRCPWSHDFQKCGGAVGRSQPCEVDYECLSNRKCCLGCGSSGYICLYPEF
ncbi:uncharacterized protein LOC143018893 [Oratosquilla oratoria]|uniref:uncharacterized protein LOC143018893 n=1 Tax=Oratosquilla oratoria TaxID=337810 RepID=UPI003F75938D